MGIDGSKISWTDGTWNGWMGCTRVGPECWNCYIEFPNMGFGKRDPWAEIYLSKTWDQPRLMQARMPATEYKKIFTCSLSDFFHKDVDNKIVSDIPMYRRYFEKTGTSLWRPNAWQVIKDCPNLVFQILTKRPERIADHLPFNWGEGYPNVWLGTSVGCNKTLNRIDHLREVPIHPDAVRFISAEPLLEDISEKINLEGIGWLIAGGESGPGDVEYYYDPNKRGGTKPQPGRRIMKLEWAYNLMLRAKTTDNIPFYFKQVTSARSGVGADALGMVFHECPPAPNSGVWWQQPANPLVVLP